MRKRDVPKAALRVFVKQSRSDIRMPKQIKHDLGFHEISGGAEFLHTLKYPQTLPWAQQKNLLICALGTALAFLAIIARTLCYLPCANVLTSAMASRKIQRR